MRRQQQQKAAVPLNLGSSNPGSTERKKPWWFDDNRNSAAVGEKDRNPKEKEREGVSLVCYNPTVSPHSLCASDDDPRSFLCVTPFHPPLMRVRQEETVLPPTSTQAQFPLFSHAFRTQ